MQRKEKETGIADFSIVDTILDIQGLAICPFRCFLAVPASKHHNHIINLTTDHIGKVVKQTVT